MPLLLLATSTIATAQIAPGTVNRPVARKATPAPAPAVAAAPVTAAAEPMVRQYHGKL